MPSACSLYRLRRRPSLSKLESPDQKKRRTRKAEEEDKWRTFRKTIDRTSPRKLSWSLQRAENHFTIESTFYSFIGPENGERWLLPLCLFQELENGTVHRMYTSRCAQESDFGMFEDMVLPGKPKAQDVGRSHGMLTIRFPKSMPKALLC